MGIDLKALDKSFKKLEKDLGKEIIRDRAGHEKILRVPCESPTLNYITGGGTPLYRIIELYGMESGGKSLIAIQIAKEFQQAGHFVVFIDLERTFDYEFYERLGLDTSPELFKLFRPSNAEDAFTIASEVIKAGAGLIIVDSVGAMKSQAEENSEMTDQHMALTARVMGKGLRKLLSLFDDHGATGVFINQLRSTMAMYGPKEDTTGGKALKFFSSIRVEVRKKEVILSNKIPVGIKTLVRNKKNKTAPPFREGEISIYFDRGIDTDAEYVEFASRYGFIVRAGAWYTCHNGERFQGMEKVLAYYAENREAFLEVRELVMNYEATTTKNAPIIEETDQESEEDS